MAINIAKLQQSVLASTGSNITALQAYEYAESKADIVRAKKYDELSAQVKKDLAESNYQDEVLLSEENSTDEYKERTATVNVYLKDEARPRASLKVLRTSVEQSAGVPIGSILPWPSNVLPKEGGTWLLCNGQSTAGYPQLSAIVGGHVPDYRGIFLRGNGSQVSSHYGTVTHTSAALGVLQGDAIRNIAGKIRLREGNGGAYPSSLFAYSYAGEAGYQGGNWGRFGWVNFDTSRVVPTANENRPANRSVNWIIRAA